MDRIEFDNSSAVERTKSVREVERTRADERRQGPEKRKPRRRRNRKHEDPEPEEKKGARKIGENLDIEA